MAVDSHAPRSWADVSPTLVTPSFAEAVPLLSGEAVTTAAERAAAVAGAGAELLRRTGAQTAAVTLDVDGAVVLTVAEAAYRTRSTPAPTSHTIGAGDAYLAAFALALSVGSAVPVAAEPAQLAAGVALGGQGTCVCGRDELVAAIPGPPRPHRARVVGAAELVALVQDQRAHGARIVVIDGCFDVRRDID